MQGLSAAYDFKILLTLLSVFCAGLVAACSVGSVGSGTKGAAGIKLMGG